MKKIMLIGLILVISLLLVMGCSDDDDDDVIETIYAYGLEQFVPVDALSDLIVHEDDDNEEWRDLFYFWPTASDGFSARNKGYDDLDWQNWLQGYYIPELDNRVYFPQFEEMNIGAYNVKYMQDIYVFRGIRSVITDTLSVVYELNAMDTQQIENYDGEMEDAIALADFIPPHFTAIDSVAFVAVDGWEKTYTPEEINDGYWLVNSQKTIFPGFPEMSGSKKKFKWLKTIMIYGAWEEQEDFVNEYLAPAAAADWNFSFPEDLSDFTNIPWE